MEEFTAAAAYLPPAIREAVLRMPWESQRITQEIRLRAGAPVALSTPAGELLVTQSGQVREHGTEGALICDAAQVEDCFQRLCDYSVHAHQQEIRQGYISTRNGCRAGIAGSVVTENGAIVAMRQVTSICLRIARRHDGCAQSLAAALTDTGGVHSALLAGEPSSGKTSLLRDLARQLASGRFGRRYRTAVVDERGELSANGGLTGCDVLLHCPKGEGIQLAVRCLAPDVVFFDEIGSMEEVQAVTAGLNAGVPAIASAHCRDLPSLLRRAPIRAALESGAFDFVVLLEGRRTPGSWHRILSWEDVYAEGRGSAADCGGRGVSGVYSGSRTRPPGRFS